ncbi:hypothetical protein HNQ93_000853 [Hymenobacter luteus]|uniref:Uncharacterized protein n=2 Tax=Hymenobacter TaxID=89966 RepID=A0A7W9SZR9_9BACT|nr:MULTISPECIES: hypothetical protein [Hymenobacter]MBB4599667.1 hypothetical protein [Hymenobacter latericoloratus]MBB6058023.1 hypothetical protein [Hymenobacter luteus]
MKVFTASGLRLPLLVLAVLLASACHPYRMPSPTGPPQPKVKKAKNPDNQSADGRALDVEKEAVKTQKNSYDKNGLLKKPKYERRRLKHKVGQRKFLGIVLPDFLQ